MTLIPLDTWRKILAFNPWYFWQYEGGPIASTSSCPEVTYQYAWQNADAVGRAEILEAIEQAEARLTSFLRYSPAPHYIVENHQFPHYPDVRVDKIGYVGGDGRWPAIQLNEGFIQKVGVQVRTLLDTVAVTYSDEDGDGLDESWSATCNVTFTDTTQVAVYFQDTDRLDSDPVSEKYRIQPVKVSISGGVATIRGKAWLMAPPILYEGVAPEPLDPTVAANFVSNIEVYQLYTDPTGSTLDTAQAKLIWETRPHPYWCTCSSCQNVVPQNSLDPAAEGYAMCRVALRDAELGLVGLGEAKYNSTSGVWTAVNWSVCRPPDRVEVRYTAGKPLVNNEMSSRMQQVVARMAAAEMAKPICACADANRQLYYWQFDIARTGGADGEQYQAISADVLNNPFGTRRGHVEAWREVKDSLRLISGFAVG